MKNMGWIIRTLLGLSSQSLVSALQHSENVECTGVKAVSPRCSSNESPMMRDFFYIGGEYVYEADYGSSIYSNQMYVEKLTPVSCDKTGPPLVLIHAGLPSGAVYLLQPFTKAQFDLDKSHSVLVYSYNGIHSSKILSRS